MPCMLKDLDTVRMAMLNRKICNAVSEATAPGHFKKLKRTIKKRIALSLALTPEAKERPQFQLEPLLVRLWKPSRKRWRELR